MSTNSRTTADVLCDHSQTLRATLTGSEAASPSTILHLIGRWIERGKQRRALAALDRRLLSDIGVSSEQAARETAKPFWR